MPGKAADCGYVLAAGLLRTPTDHATPSSQPTVENCWDSTADRLRLAGKEAAGEPAYCVSSAVPVYEIDICRLEGIAHTLSGQVP